MISRQAEPALRKLATQFPVVGIVGPRQSGKTTLAKSVFTGYDYVSMEDLDVRALALEDPRRFFAAHQNSVGLIIDEVQEAPALLNYLQGIVDAQPRPGFYVLTGSQNILVHEKISQSLAGRIALLTLLPLSMHELQAAKLRPATLEEALFKGAYPRVHAQSVDPLTWYKNYLATYIERDVRTLTNVTDLVLFQKFMKLCAGRVGQLLNYTALANDCGISPNTAKAWLSLLHVSYIIFLITPHFNNVNKRLIKSPKLYFYDTGLCSHLLDIDDPKQLYSHYMRGGLFESFVISECFKNLENAYQTPHIHFWRDVQGNEVDLMLTRGQRTIPVEIKSGQTIQPNFFDGIAYWKSLIKSQDPAFLVYGGNNAQPHAIADIVPWFDIDQLTDTLIKPSAP